MNRIPPALRARLAEDPYMKACARHSPDCRGRVTWEHALTYAGKQVQEAWAIVPLCEWHHLGAGLNKQINIRLALSRATPEQLLKYERADWIQQSRPKI